MYKLITTCSLVVLLSGCVSTGPTFPNYPENYDGPVTRIMDTAIQKNANSSVFFYVKKINDRSIKTSISYSLESGNPYGYDPLLIDIYFPTRKSTLTIGVDTITSPPVFALFNKSFSLEGQVELDPQPGEIYTVKGIIKGGHTAV